MKVGDWVEVDVPEVDWIGPAYTTFGLVARADPGCLLVIDCIDGRQYWRETSEVRLITSEGRG